jgi:threonine synthase
MERAYALFSAYRLDDEGTVAEIATTAKNDGMVLDPHSAVGLSAARRAHADGTVPKDVPIISLACAHPAKFESAVETATGQKPVLPPHMADLMTRPEKMQTIDANADAVKSLVLARKRSG